MSKYCSVCKRPIDSEEPAVLTMGAYGYPKHICSECEKNIDTAITSCEYDEIVLSCRKLGDSLTRGDTGDLQVINTVNNLISSAGERAEAIKAGTYDFSLDDTEEEEFEITEDIRETDEDRAKDERDAKVSRLVDIINSWAAGIILVGAVVFFVIKFVF